MSQETFNKFVEIGRVCMVNYGQDQGKICVITDLVSLNRAVVDGQEVERQSIPISRLTLTPQKVNIHFGAHTGRVRKAIQKANVKENFLKSALGRKIAKAQRRAQLNDFQRFKVMILKKRLSRILRNKKLCVEEKKKQTKKENKDNKKPAQKEQKKK